MALTVIEGTWEEIKSHEADLIGKQLRLTVQSERPDMRIVQSQPEKQVVAKAKKSLRGYGMLAGILDVEDFMRRKQEEIDLEDRPRE